MQTETLETVVQTETPEAVERTGTPETAVETDARIPSARGLLCAFNTRGQSLGLTALKKWAGLCAQVHKAEKVDVWIRAAEKDFLEELLRFETAPRLHYSARIAAGELDPAWLTGWRALGLWDVVLELQSAAEWAQAGACVQSARALELPVRLEIAAGALTEDRTYPAGIEQVQAVNISACGTLANARGSRVPPLDASHLARATALADVLRQARVETNLVGFPFCTLPDHLWPHCVNHQQALKDHQQYIPESLRLAETLAGLAPHAAEKVLEIELGRQTSWLGRVDSLVLPWILRRPGAYVGMWMVHKLIRHLHLRPRRPKPLPESVDSVDAEIDRLRKKKARRMGAICAQCRFGEICDHRSRTFRQAARGLEIKAIPGAALLDPFVFLRRQHKWFDELDAARRDFPERALKLAAEALRISTQEQPSREIPSDSYDDEEGVHCHHMPGTVRWHSFENVEVMSTALARVEPPFTIGLTLGGGIAAQAGFSFGRHAKLVCPMIAHTHKLVLHVDAGGRYALLRDRVLVRPTEFSAHKLLPERLGGVLEPRISLWNIDGQVCTQNVLLWEQVEAEQREQAVKFSVVVVSTRYSRRLQAALLGIAHQADIAPGSVEVVVAYVPGIDATDDLLDGMAMAHPQLRIMRSPFPRNHVRSKGFMINESVKATSGEWIVLLDSDIVLQPDFFARLEREGREAKFCAPDGRKMLTPETTARVLLGEARPWAEYEQLQESPGEVRLHESAGVPPGFCQCVRREVLDSVPYREFEHFEGADWDFARRVMDRFGEVKRLAGMRVLHLDHQGSQWYGTDKHM